MTVGRRPIALAAGLGPGWRRLHDAVIVEPGTVDDRRTGHVSVARHRICRTHHRADAVGARPAPLDPSPAPTAPAGLARIADDGARRHPRADRARAQSAPGRRAELGADLLVTNRGDDDVTWFHDGCALPAFVRGRSLVPWPMGIDQPSAVERFKAYALGGHISLEPSPFAVIQFVREEHLANGELGCADIGISDEVRASGESIEETLWWSGFTAPNRALPRPGALSITAYAGYYWRGRQQPKSIVDQALELSLDAWIEAPDLDPLSPAQAIDAALVDPAFLTYLDTQQLANGREEIALVRRCSRRLGDRRHAVVRDGTAADPWCSGRRHEWLGCRRTTRSTVG